MEEKELYHYGVLGMKWGVRRYQKKDGSYTKEGLSRLAKKNLKNARSKNVDKWGLSEDTNILYIAGYSGSGKSTTALGIANKNDKIIHLDLYSEPIHAESTGERNSDFDSYLNRVYPDWKRMTNATKTGENGTLKRFSIEYWNAVDTFRKAIETYGKECFKQGDRVIVEGVQLADGWLTEDNSYFLNKPTVVLETNPLTSIQRRLIRDDQGTLVTIVKDPAVIKQYIDWYSSSSRRLNDLSTTIHAKKGRKIVKNLF